MHRRFHSSHLQETYQTSCALVANIERDASSPGVENLQRDWDALSRDAEGGHLGPPLSAGPLSCYISACSDLLEHLNSLLLSMYALNCQRTGFVRDLTTLLSAISRELSRRLHDITTHPTWPLFTPPKTESWIRNECRSASPSSSPGILTRISFRS